MTLPQSRRATFNVVALALRNSAHAGSQTRPLQPGERRSFEVDVPSTFDADADVDPEKYGATVLHARFAE